MRGVAEPAFHLAAPCRAGALIATAAEEEVVPASAFRAQQEQIRELQHLLGKKTLEVEILKDALEMAEDIKNEDCGRCRGRNAICRERGRGDAGHGPFASRRVDGAACGRAPATAQRLSALAGRGAAGRDRCGHRRHVELRLCPHLGQVAS